MRSSRGIAGCSIAPPVSAFGRLNSLAAAQCSVEMRHVPALAAATVRCDDYYRERSATYERVACLDEDEQLQHGLALSRDPTTGEVALASWEDIEFETTIQKSLGNDTGWR